MTLAKWLTVVWESVRQEGELTTQQTYQRATNRRSITQDVERWDPRHDIVAGMRNFILQHVRNLLGDTTMKRRVQVRVDNDVAVSNIVLHLLIA